MTLWNTISFWALCVYLSDYCLYNKTSKNKRLICTAEVAFLRCFTSWCTGNLNINIHHVLISLFLCQVQKHLELSLFCFSAFICGLAWFHFSLYSPTNTSSYARLLSSFKLCCVEEINSWCGAGKWWCLHVHFKIWLRIPYCAIRVVYFLLHFFCIFLQHCVMHPNPLYKLLFSST